ncbi:hypothetical protein BC833DRAFT_605056 [Globomyces pollinis-pini]|nr:hypothetical protein BC833DRAFT_605056 [Globomyces pollinis-pini]
MQVSDIPLSPENAKVGLDIRVVGNDAGEKLSILAGSLSRLDRNAPDYGELTYNDFNTFYLQAASSTSGGSSGSPVLNIDGHAVGLQAGGHTKAATDFFFPLDRVKRVLGLIQKGHTVTRGTIQVHFTHRPFDQVRRLGLRDSVEKKIRLYDPKEIGMLVAETVLPKGPGSFFLQESDILVSINNQIVTKFVPLEDYLDSNVGKTIQFTIERGGEELTFDIIVQDLHSITPDRYLQIGGGTLNNVSYQLSRQFCLPAQGVFVSDPAGMFRLDGTADSGWIIDTVDCQPTHNLDEFISVFQTIPDYSRVSITYYSIGDVHTKHITIVSVDRHWYPFRLAVRNDTTGLWDFTDLGPPIPRKPIQPSNATFPELDSSLGVSRSLLNSFVKVTMTIPCRIDGYPKSRKVGAGLVVNVSMGLVLVSKHVVPFSIGDVLLTFADSIVIPGTVIFSHPTHNIAIVSYNPKHIGTTPVHAAPISNQPLVQGHKVTLVAYNLNQRPVCIETTVTDIAIANIPQNSIPRFRAVNFNAITLDTPVAQQCYSGVLADKKGHVQGLWLSFLGDCNQNGQHNQYFLGLDIRHIMDTIVNKLSKGLSIQQLCLRGLAAEFETFQISHARALGLSDARVSMIEKANPSKRQLLIVKRTEAGSATAKVLHDLDIVLTVNGQTVTDISDVDVHGNWDAMVPITVLRDKREVSLMVPTVPMDSYSTKHIVIWAGAVLQEPHKAVLQQSKTVPSRIYISGRSKGSPSYGSGLAATQWITHVNGVATNTLQQFLEVVRDIPDNTFCRVKTLSFDNVPSMVSVKVGLHYWPTTELVLVDGVWKTKT